MRALSALLWLVVLVTTASGPPATLPPSAVRALADSLDAARPHERHLWRDTPALNADGTVSAYVEITRGDRRKWEFDMARQAVVIDRVIPEEPGGYPVNYGFVPQTVSYDGDPLDALVLGRPLQGGEIVRGVIVGLLRIEDDKGLDAKVVLSPPNDGGEAAHRLTEADRARIARYFSEYKRHEPDKFSRVSGWGSADEGRAFVETMHAFFKECRLARADACTVEAAGIR